MGSDSSIGFIIGIAWIVVVGVLLYFYWQTGAEEYPEPTEETVILKNTEEIKKTSGEFDVEMAKKKTVVVQKITPRKEVSCYDVICQPSAPTNPRK